MWTYQYPDYLIHGGPGSGRYPAGSGERPWQHRGIRGYMRRRKERKQQKQYAQNRETLRRKRAESERQKTFHEKDKARAIAEGDATGVLRYRSELSNQELRSALERVQLNAQLNNFAKADLNKSWKRMDDAVTTVKRINDYTSAAITLGKNAKTIYDMLDGKFPGDKKKDEEKKKEKSS